MSVHRAPADTEPYDEFGLLPENAEPSSGSTARSRCRRAASKSRCSTASTSSAIAVGRRRPRGRVPPRRRSERAHLGQRRARTRSTGAGDRPPGSRPLRPPRRPRLQPVAQRSRRRRRDGAARAACVRRGRHVARRRDHDSARRDPSGPRAARGDRRRHAAGERPDAASGPPPSAARPRSSAGRRRTTPSRRWSPQPSRCRRSAPRPPCAAASATTCTNGTTASGRGATTCSATIPKHRRNTDDERRPRLE